MKTLHTLLIVCFSFLVFSCSSITVKHDYDSEANFAALKSFDWMALPEGKTLPNKPLLDRRIKDAVQRNLSAQNISQSSDSPDFLVVYHTGVQNHIDVDTWGYRYARRGRYYGWGVTTVDVQKYKYGTLILDFVDAKTKELIWRGHATGVLPDNLNPEKMGMKINEAVTKILKKFPPLKQTT